MTDYEIWYNDKTDENYNRLHPLLLIAAEQVAQANMNKRGMGSYRYKHKHAWDELISDMISEFIIEHSKKDGTWKCNNIHNWLYFAYARIVYNKHNIVMDQSYDYIHTMKDTAYMPKERKLKETEYIDWIRDEPAGRMVIYYLSKKTWSYRRIFDTLMTYYGVEKRWIMDNSEILMKTAKILRYY
jgi:hypothetical protein